MEEVARPIFLLTDFGTRDHYAGQVKAVLFERAPRSTCVDITHEVEAFAIDEGAWLLETALPVIPRGSVILAVVDPGVGSEREAVAVEAGGRWFVGPDNGLLSPAFGDEARDDVGGAATPARVSAGVSAHRIANPAYRRADVSHTFHARDIFAPAAAALATGVPVAAVGPRVDMVTLLPPFRGEGADGGALHGYVVHLDRYGNLVTTIRGPELPPRYALIVAGHRIPVAGRTFSDVGRGELVSHVDSSGFVAVACNQGNAARMLGAKRGTRVIVEPE